MDAAETLAADVGTAAACRAMGVARATLYRHRRPKEPPKETRPKRRQPRALDHRERQAVLDVLHSPRFVDKAPAAVWAALLDEGTYHCSIRTMYRILHDHAEVRERRNQLRHPNYKKPELLATGPNQVWSWDITKLLGPAKWTYFYLYVILDIYSRYAVGWMLASRENADLAKRLIRDSIDRQNVSPGELIIHSDRGPSMKSHTVAQLLGSLGVTKSHSRPHVSNDNPFSESQFKTLKYRPDFPDRFGSQQDAHAFCKSFFHWYNHEHYHSGLGMLTPAAVHYGRACEILATRQQTLDAAFGAHPERFVCKPPEPLALPEAVWINPPRSNEVAGECPNNNEMAGEHLSSRAHEKGLPADAGEKPAAPSAHPRPGYPSSSCVPALLDSVSPGSLMLPAAEPHENPPSDTRAMPQKIPGVWGLASALEENRSRSETKLH
jgi:putative transposase